MIGSIILLNRSIVPKIQNDCGGAGSVMKGNRKNEVRNIKASHQNIVYGCVSPAAVRADAFRLFAKK